VGVSTPTAAIEERAALIEQLWTLPGELRELEQWCVWRYELRAGKPTKVPYECGGLKPLVRARINDPGSWSSFGAAVTVFEHARWARGVLFALTAADPFVFIDLDGCREPQTGAVEEWARDILAAVPGYKEVSVSGRGVHIITRGELPPVGRRREGVEMYCDKRFAALTGERVRW
jgi:putative DNA primase/helicase